MFFEVSGIEIAVWIPPLVAFIISSFTAMGGISGAFILLPFQMSVLGFTSPAVSSTNQLFNIVAIPSGVWRYIKEGRMVWPLTWIVVIGTLPGVLIGAFVRILYLPDPASFKFFAGFVLLYIGIRLIIDMLKKKTNNNSAEDRFSKLVKEFRNKKEHGKELPRTKVNTFNLSVMEYEFYGEKYSIPTLKIGLISFLVGIVGGIYGIGGGAIMAPFFVAFFGLPVYTVAGAALMGTFITSIAGVFFYQLLALYYTGISIAPDWLLGILFGIGGFAGMYFGAFLQKYLPAKFIKGVLAVSISFIALKYIFEFLF
jgi:uncharacterized protein